MYGRGFVGLSAVSVLVHTQIFWGPKDFDDACLICSIYSEQSVGKEGGRGIGVAKDGKKMLKKDS